MSYHDISSHISDFYDHKISSGEISSITDKLMPLMNEWRSRPLEKVYPVVFLDGMYFKVKEGDRVVNKCVYTVLGINQKERKEVLGFCSSENEGDKFSMGVLSNLKERGLDDILIISVDGLKELPEAITHIYPNAQVQLCVVHQIRNSLGYITYKDVKAFLNDLKKVYKASHKEIAESYLEELQEKWGTKYPMVLKSWKNNWEHLSAYFQYAEPIRRIIYTTNPIEELHRQIRKFTKTKVLLTPLMPFINLFIEL